MGLDLPAEYHEQVGWLTSVLTMHHKFGYPKHCIQSLPTFLLELDARVKRQRQQPGQQDQPLH